MIELLSGADLDARSHLVFDGHEQVEIDLRGLSFTATLCTLEAVDAIGRHFPGAGLSLLGGPATAYLALHFERRLHDARPDLSIRFHGRRGLRTWFDQGVRRCRVPRFVSPALGWNANFLEGVRRLGVLVDDRRVALQGPRCTVSRLVRRARRVLVDSLDPATMHALGRRGFRVKAGTFVAPGRFVFDGGAVQAADVDSVLAHMMEHDVVVGSPGALLHLAAALSIPTISVHLREPLEHAPVGSIAIDARGCTTLDPDFLADVVAQRT